MLNSDIATAPAATELHPGFSDPDAIAPPWEDTLAIIEHASIFWLSTVRRDGRPHVTPLPAMWLDGSLHFCTGPGEQKARNLEHNPNCILTTGTNVFGSGRDVVVEGQAARVTDRSLLERLAKMWQDQLDWQFVATDGGFRDESRGLTAEELDEAGPVHVFAVAPHKVLAFDKGEPFSQTRYRFGN